MPELPEVETVMRGLMPHMQGARFKKVEQRRENLRFPFPDCFVQRLEGAEILQLRRRAKYILVDLSSDETLILHLGMSGRVSINGAKEGTKQAHDHVVFHLSNKDVVTYNDPRRFGFMVLARTSELETHDFFKDLGPEPLGNAFDEIMLASKAKGRKTPLKSFFLDQKVVAGLGNIYVLEALHQVGLSPLKPASVLATKTGKPKPITSSLVVAIRDVLNDAIASGGSTLKDYAKADGSLGYFQHAFQVYGREGEPCLKKGCGGTVKRIQQSGRSSFYCPTCQK